MRAGSTRKHAKRYTPSKIKSSKQDERREVERKPPQPFNTLAEAMKRKGLR